MTYEVKDNTGTLFKNFKKEKESQPDFKGDAMVDGIKKSIAAWKKTSKGGNEYLSISFSDFKESEGPTEHQEAKANGYAPKPLEDSIPF